MRARVEKVDVLGWNKSNGKKRRSKDEFSFEILTDWTNNKAHMSGAGKKVQKGGWDVFSARELRQHFVIYLLQGLAPSQKIKYKFNTQCRDIFSANSFVYNSFGSNFKRSQRHYKASLA